MMTNYKHSYTSINTENLSIYVCNVGFQKCESLHQWGPGIRKHYLIHHIISGKGYYKTNNNLYKIKSGDTFIIYPDTEVYYYADNKDPWEYYWVGFNGTGNTVINLLSHTDFSKNNLVISKDFGNELKSALLKIYKHSGNGYFNLIKMSGYLHLAIAILIEKSEKITPQINNSLFYAQCASEYISFNYQQPITIDDIANYIGISRSHLYRVFNEIYMISPKQYLTSFRINESCMLLSNTNLSIGVIASSVGYEDHLYFSKVFHKIKKLSPSDYRRKNQN